ncbi:MAG: hypothetical protein MJY99_02120 [Fibrobacter sp.]|nr:hypothetical protein [Fibrobacter sp.]
MIKTPFVLLCAGEDSGDVLGEGLVSAVLQSGLKACGAGGSRMLRAGLEPLIDFEELPVSGFGDVLPRYFRLRKLYNVMSAALRFPECVAFVAIDYPGFNMGLTILAKKLNKPVLYVAPPQVWAWKHSRAKKLQGVKLAVLFEFEKEVYEKYGCNVGLLRHPFAESSSEQPRTLGLQQSLEQSRTSAENAFLLLPGSRQSQALRNLNFYLNIVKFGKKNPIKILAARASLVAPFEKSLKLFFDGTVPEGFSVQVVPTNAKDRAQLFASACGALAAPGTATLELALSACPLVVATVPDRLTYAMGKMFVRTDSFAMPNILLQQKVISEFITPSGACKTNVRGGIFEQILSALENCKKDSAIKIAESLRQKLQGGKLPLEFLGQVLQREAH